MDNHLREKWQLMELALTSFAFLEEWGFHLKEQHEPTGPSFKEGFQLVFSQPPIEVTVQYYDMEFVVWFKNGNTKTDFTFLDKHLNDGAGGFHGAMFPQNKLAPIIDRIADIIQGTMESVGKGDPAVWTKIEKLCSVPAPKRKLP